MRRRIYIDPEGPLSDITSHPYLYDLDHDDTRLGICCTGALYDEDLWLRYQAAEAEASRLHALVVAAMKIEPWDATERDLAERSKLALFADSDSAPKLAEMDQLGAAAVAHAATKKAPQ